MLFIKFDWLTSTTCAQNTKCLVDSVGDTATTEVEFDEGEDLGEYVFYTFTFPLSEGECKTVDVWVVSADGESEPTLTMTDEANDYTFRKYNHAGNAENPSVSFQSDH